MRRIRWGLAIAALISVVITVQDALAMTAQGSTITITLARAVQGPVSVELALEQPAIVRLDRPVVVVTDSPPDLVHPIVHGSTVLLVPMREGSAVVALGLGDGVSVKLAVSIGTEAGIRLISLSGSAVTGASSATSRAHVQRNQPDPVAASTADSADPPADSVGSFIATLSPDQRQALVDYLRSPSLPSLSTLVRLLSSSQQRILVDALASHDAQAVSVPQVPQSAPAVAAAPPQPVHVTAPPKPTQADPRVIVSAPAGITVRVVATPTRGILYLSYVLQNGTGKTLHADPREVEVAGANGPVTVRQMDVGTPGEIAVGSMETGVITVAPASDRVSVTWRLRDDGGNVVPLGIILMATSH